MVVGVGVQLPLQDKSKRWHGWIEMLLARCLVAVFGGFLVGVGVEVRMM